MSQQTLNTILDNNAKHISDEYVLWLADSYDTLPDYRGRWTGGTETPIDPNWRSPFIGKTIPDVVAFMRATPKPPKPLSKRYCAVLTWKYFKTETLLICKSLEGEEEVELEWPGGEWSGPRDIKKAARELGDDFDGIQVVGMDVEKVGEFHYTFWRHEYRWLEYWLEWREEGVELG